MATAAAPGLYGPQPRYEEPDAPEPFVVEPAALEPAAPVTAPPPSGPALPAAPVTAPPPSGPALPAAADAAEQRMVAAGVSAGLAADVVGEAAAHGLPVRLPARSSRSSPAPRSRAASPCSPTSGPTARVIAVAGAGGAGKSALIGRLAAAYAAADHEVVVVALRSRDGGCGLAAELEPLGVSVIAASDAAQAARRLRHREPLVTLIDTPALGSGDARAAAALAPELRALGATEVHLALPATVSAAAADEVAAALAPLGLTHVALTHADQTARPGAPVELADPHPPAALLRRHARRRRARRPRDPRRTARAMSRLRSRYVSVQLPLHRRAARRSWRPRTTPRSCSRSRSRRRPGSAASTGAPCASSASRRAASSTSRARSPGRPDQPECLRVTKESDDVIQRREAVRVQAVVPVQSPSSRAAAVGADAPGESLRAA